MNWEFKEYRVVASTQVTAERLAREGAREGTVVLAKRQTAGRGRFGRRWVSPIGGLYMSIILRPTRPDVGVLALAGALSVVEGLKSAEGMDAGIRWPNDVMILGSKVGGVVGTASYRGPTPDYAVLGIGVNCNVSARYLRGVGQSSTSLMETLGAKVDLGTIKDHVLGSFDRIYWNWKEGGDGKIIGGVTSVLTTIGRKVEFKRLGLKPQTGIARGLSGDGSLLVRSGERAVRLRAEGVEWLREK